MPLLHPEQSDNASGRDDRARNATASEAHAKIARTKTVQDLVRTLEQVEKFLTVTPAPLISAARLLFLLAAARGLAPARVDRRGALVAGGAAVLGAGAPLAAARRAAAGRAELGRSAACAMPTLALNTVGLTAESTERAVRLALDQGVAHVDFHPGAERDGVARAAARGAVRPRPAVPHDQGAHGEGRERHARGGRGALPRDSSREDLLACARARRRATVDMWMLRDNPDCDVMRAQWAVLEDEYRAGRARALGVVNFCEARLSCVLETAKVKPSVNYYMLHAGMGRDAHGLRSFGERKGVRTFAYGALGEGPEPSLSLSFARVSECLTARLGVAGTARSASAAPDSPSPLAERALLPPPPLLPLDRRRARRAPPSRRRKVAVKWLLQEGVAVSARPTAEFGLGRSECRDDGSCSTACATGGRPRLEAQLVRDERDRRAAQPRRRARALLARVQPRARRGRPGGPARRRLLARRAVKGDRDDDKGQEAPEGRRARAPKAARATRTRGAGPETAAAAVARERGGASRATGGVAARRVRHPRPARRVEPRAPAGPRSRTCRCCTGRRRARARPRRPAARRARAPTT